MSGRSGFTLAQLLVVLGIIGIVAALALPSLVRSRRASNERDASVSLKILSSAEADFRANDRDGNGVNDFWTGDVKGLYTVTCARDRHTGTGVLGFPLQLISPDLAASDADPCRPEAGGLNTDLSPFARPEPHHGYWTAALIEDRSDDSPDRVYRQDTGGTVPMGRCHHLRKFGFSAIPESPRVGMRVYVINENNSEFQHFLDQDVIQTPTVPPGLNGIPREFLHWPSDRERQQGWGTV